MKAFEDINRKKIVGVPGLVIFLIILLIISQTPSEENEAKLNLIRELLAFTQQNEYPDCQIIDLYAPIKERQRDNDNLYLEPSHIVRYTNQYGREEHIGKGIMIDKLNIARLVDYLITTPGAGLDCSIGDGTVRGANWIEVQTMVYSKQYLSLSFLTKGRPYALSLFYTEENGIKLDHIDLYGENGGFVIKVKEQDSEVVQAVVTEGTNVVELSLNQLLNGDFSSVWGEYTQLQLNAVKDYVNKYTDIIKLVEKLGFSSETKEIFRDFQTLVK
ncbi:MAG: hypothetical protein ACMG57_05135 [Candidatus Dojkabacteria bacterium]